MNAMAFRVAAAFLVSCGVMFAAAADYPTKPVRLVVVYPPVGGTPEEFAAFIASEIKKWGAAVKTAKATVD